MNKRNINLIIIMLLIVTTLATAQLRTDIIKQETINGVNVTYEYERIYRGDFPVYDYVIENMIECNVTRVDVVNETVCGMVNRPVMQIVGYEPLYEEGEIKRMTVRSTQVDFNTEGCYPCGNYMLCLDVSDGYSQDRADEFKCQLRSGETGRIVPI